MKGPATAQERVARARPQAVTALAAFLRRPQLTERIDELIGLALLDYQHTTICALRSLAGLMTPGAPGTYRLPSDRDGEHGATT